MLRTFGIMKIEELYGKDYTFVDVRSPKEFEEDHIPDAINIPLFSNEERAIVGTIYKQESKDKAVDVGLEIVSKKLPEMINEYKKISGKICVYCWRGGMRSGSVTSLLKSMKFDVVQLENGYKDYRRFVREQLDKINIPPMIVLYGLTGSGKTEFLQKLENSLDLEGLAQHRGSIFGDVGLKPRSQKMFESLMLKKLFELQNYNCIFVEGESRKVGPVSIPLRVWECMQKAKKVKLVSTLPERVERIYKEYCNNLDLVLIKKKLKQIEKFLGNKKVVEYSRMLDNGLVKEVLELILVEYYDHLYKHTVDSKVYEFEFFSVDELLRKSKLIF